MRKTTERVRENRARRGRNADFLRLDEVALGAEGLGDLRAGGGKLDLLRVKGAWGGAVGPHLHAATRPAWYRVGHLVVDVKDMAWKRELECLGSEVKARLSALEGLPRIESLTFRVRSARFQPAAGDAGRRSAESGPAAAGSAEHLSDLMAPLQRVPDADLRERLMAVMGRYLLHTSMAHT